MAQVPFIGPEKINDGPLGNVQEPAQKLEDEPPRHFTRDVRPKPLRHSPNRLGKSLKGLQ